ncbi:uncharacterized protein LOC114076853 [Solanum pennellii]|uniref:Uncharacterized protein LOC114076853 n=1 Tax=Solanum pennellii TaxID=28526 RepID=A0ABM1V9D6_SOLPN|nr:uncharacterized protein LOC114076853 [Solanum pennellii]
MAQAITMQAQAMTAQVNREDVQRENRLVRSMADRLRDFTRMNPPIFTGAKTSEDPQEFIDELHKILVAMGATDIQKAELASYQLKDVAQTWCKMWRDSRVLGGVPVTWELFKTAFLERLMVHVQQVEDSRKRRGVRNDRRPRPQDQAVPNHGGHRNNFGIREQPKFNKGQQSSCNSDPQRNTTPRGGRPEPKRVNGDCPQNRGQAGGNAQPRSTPQSAAAAEPPKRNKFYALKGREEQEKSAYVATESPVRVHAEGAESTATQMVGAAEGL